MIALVLALLAQAISEPAAPRAIVAQAATVLPSGTAVRLVTAVPVNSRSAQQGQRFGLTVAADVTAGGRVLIPAGTPAVGEVEAVSGKGMVGQGARLTLVPLFIDAPGRRITLSGTLRQEGSSPTTEVAAASLLVSGLGLFITGKSALVPAGTVIPAVLRSDVTFDPPQP